MTHNVLANPDTEQPPDSTIQTVTVDPWILTIDGSRAGVYTKEMCQLTS